jgi:methionyl aminopeptidase
VGEIDEESKKLIRTTRESLDEAIKMCKPGALFRDIGKAMYVFTFISSQVCG